MAIINNKVRETASGLITRFDENLGLLVYSPFNSLIYAVHMDYAEDTINWLNKKRKMSPSDEFTLSLGAGWNIPHAEARYTMPQLLPIEAWKALNNPKWPIVVNWFITGNCPLECEYCYAEDLMHGRCKEPSKTDIGKIAKTILSYNPLAVVITGGDPLYCPNFSEAIKALYGKAGIIVDTSGFTFSNEHLNVFKKYNVAVRISIDSERPNVNKLQRPVSKKLVSTRTSLDAALVALCKCIDAGITTSVQTVATKKNANDLVAFGDKLFRLGIRSWRILRVCPSSERMKGYKELIGTALQQKNLYKHIFSSLSEAYGRHWGKRMAVQVTENEASNAVILVSPDGRFMTESSLGTGKINIDSKNPMTPRQKMFQETLNLTAHAERYLNLTYHNHKQR